jgi:hypothetical protein
MNMKVKMMKMMKMKVFEQSNNSHNVLAFLTCTDFVFLLKTNN